MPEPIKPEHRPYIDTIRRLWEESGGKVFDAEVGGLRPYPRASEAGAVELLFDYDIPLYLCVDEGNYMPLGLCTVGDTEKFRRLLSETYTVHVVQPQRDDSVVRRENPGAYQTQMSGPLVALVEKR